MLKNFLQGRFMRHPLHPLLVHLPVGLWVASLIFDIVFLAGGAPVFASVAYYCIAVGIVGAVLAAITGLADYVEIPSNTRPKQLATYHMILNVVVLGIFITGYFLRRGLNPAGPPELVTSGQFILSLVAVGLLGVSGYVGGLMVYDHGVGFKPQNRAARREPLRRVA